MISMETKSKGLTQMFLLKRRVRMTSFLQSINSMNPLEKNMY